MPAIYTIFSKVIICTSLPGLSILKDYFENSQKRVNLTVLLPVTWNFLTKHKLAPSDELSSQRRAEKNVTTMEDQREDDLGDKKILGSRQGGDNDVSTNTRLESELIRRINMFKELAEGGMWFDSSIHRKVLMLLVSTGLGVRTIESMSQTLTRAEN
ncbi:hypothetical protein RRG08_057735 [Elysia crispata]|uniref:Uncharacterized protein n=1 Tax=Elysia crispata TaxID=231223 RepID=A0AAE0Y8M5_9GAST|nr:hypothetical protein RRG08_057735 [Elysia crispata]